MKDRVVLLHGLGSTKHLFDEIQNFFNIGKIEILALDLPGHGETQMLENISIDLLCSWLNEKIEKPSIIAGHSLGALISLAFASRYPDKVKKIILLDGGYLFSRMFDVSLEDEIEGVKQFVENTKFHTIDDIIKSEKSELKRWSTLLEESTLKRFNRTQDGTYELIIELNTAIIYTQMFYDFQLVTLSVPVILIAATLPIHLEDFREQAIKELKIILPQVIVKRIDTSHNLIEENPELVAELISLS